MDLILEHIDVWAASIQDKPGGLAIVLKGLKEAGADLDFIIAKRATEKPGTGVVFVAPLRGDREVAAATELGFNVTSSIKAVRVEGENKPGMAAELTEKLALAGLNLRGLSAAVIGERFILYLALDTANDADKAMEVIEGTS